MAEREFRQVDVPSDPTGIEAPHDVLAADEFGIGTADRRLPPDPHRFEPPHDILAAEEFAMPAAAERHGPVAQATPGGRSVTPLLVLAAVAALLFLLRRRS
jgi:MYXO-CTERM domain-containing protein